MGTASCLRHLDIYRFVCRLVQENLNLIILNRVILNFSLDEYMSPVAEADCYCLDLANKGTENNKEEL